MTDIGSLRNARKTTNKSKTASKVRAVEWICYSNKICYSRLSTHISLQSELSYSNMLAGKYLFPLNVVQDELDYLILFISYDDPPVQTLILIKWYLPFLVDFRARNLNFMPPMSRATFIGNRSIDRYSD